MSVLCTLLCISIYDCKYLNDCTLGDPPPFFYLGGGPEGRETMMAKEMWGRGLEEALRGGHRQDEALLVEGLQGRQRGEAAKARESKGEAAAGAPTPAVVAVSAKVAGHVLIIAGVLKRGRNFY